LAIGNWQSEIGNYLMEDRTMQAVTGVFKSRETAEQAVSQLRSLGIPEKKIGVLSPDSSTERLDEDVPVSDTEDPGMGKAMGAAVGGAMGAALLGVVGAAAGSAVGDTVEEELGEGIPHEDIYLYKNALRQGHSVVIAYAADEDQSDEATEVMTNAGAEDLDTLRETTES